MSVHELKRLAAGLLADEEDEVILQHIVQLLQHDEIVHPVVLFSPEQKARIERGQEDIKNGRLYTDEEFGQRMENWLNELDEQYGKG